MITRVLAAALCALAALPLIACGSTSADDGTWVGNQVEVGSLKLLQRVTVVAFDKAGFPIAHQDDPSGRTLTSGWAMSLAPFKGDGYREKATARFEKVAEGRYKVEVRVARETNEDMAHPLDVSYADWRTAPDNEDRARIVLQYIRLLIGDDLDVSAGPRRFE